ncbi:MAG TPA: right-handed parallel beta-helix repeat-containing protein [Pyrinomonadaceae bacterium]
MFGALALLACSLAFASPARAEVTHTVVSANGLDNRLCDRANPCRTFDAAITAVEEGGEISVLSSGVYEPFTINKSVQIVAPAGVHALIAAKSGNAITVSIGPADTVVLRGLYLDGLRTASGGIRAQASPTTGTLHVENCVVSNFKGFGVYFSSGGGQLYVKDTTARNNLSGIFITGNVRATVDHCRMEQNQLDGLSAQLGARVTVRDSVAAGNATEGDLETGGFHTIDGFLNIENCVSSGNSNGIRAEGGVVHVSNTMLTDNRFGLVNAGGFGQLISYGNNRVRGNNVSNGNFTLNVGQR